MGDRVKIAAKRAGVIGHRRTMDSTGVADCVLTQDTITLIRSGVRRCLAALAAVDADAAAELVGLLSRDDYDRAAKPQIMWADPCARAALVAELFGDAEAVVGFCARFDDPGLAAAVELLGVVAGQDIETATITCPQGNTATIPPPNGAKRRQVRFAATDCSACELKARCTTRDGGRIIEINPYEELLAPARAQRHEPEFLARYRLRSQAERKIAQIKSRTKRVPWRGLHKANLWLDLRIAALNLDRAGRLGIIG